MSHCVLSIGIVGLPNVGKSTLFNALTKKAVPAENYPFCTIDPSVGIVPVPDERLGALSTLSKSAKTIPAVVEFVDIAGLVKGASEGEGLGNKFLQNIRDVDAILEVVRIFDDDKIIHVHGGVDPVSDIEVIELELILADRETVEKRLGNIQKDVKAGKANPSDARGKEAVFENETLKKVSEHLAEGKMARSLALDENEKIVLKSMHLLSGKPIMYALNKKAGGQNLDEMGNPRYEKLLAFLKERGAEWTLVDAGIENELKELEGEEKEIFRAELGGADDGLDALIKAGYRLLGLITYFTTGEDETRAWTIEKGSTAPVAGMAIHTDFRDKFIRAEVVHSADLLREGGYGPCREKGLVRTEGKEYIVQDGDVVEFRI